MKNNRNIISILLVLFLACEKELNINDFTDDFANYEHELRIEALILPSNNKAIVRIDKTIPINEIELFNCIDDDGDWNLEEDDLGEDGIAADPNNNIEADEGEGNGVPDCGEPHVDETNEILPHIHVSNCDVSISANNNTCNLVFDNTGGNFYLHTDLSLYTLDDVAYIGYGAYVPSEECIANNFNFNLSNTEYSFNCECPGEYEKYGLITATDTISKPVLFFNPDSLDNIIDCAGEAYINEDDIFSCLQVEDNSETLFVEENDEEAMIYWASIFENRFYYAEQSYYDEANDRYIYLHGHPAGGTEEAGFLINDKVSIFSEKIVTEPYFGITKFKYDIYTFSSGYRDYYFWSQLPLDDPERTNLRDVSGNPVMGGFGGMTSRARYFEVIPN